MADKESFGQIVLNELGRNHKIEKQDIGSDAVMKKNMMKFNTEVYKVKDFGHVCVLNMTAMMGLMKMETVIMAPFEKDVPLVNFDWISAAGKETYIAEFYKCMLEEYPEGYLKELKKCEQQYPELEEYDGGQHWYDELKYDCSCGKTGKKSTDKFRQMTKAYMNVFARQIQKAEKCDSEKKKAEIRKFAERLIAEGGPAVNQFKKLFGEEAARRIILGHMYGVE